MTCNFKVLVIGGRDFQLQGLLDLNINFLLFQKKDELTQYQIENVEHIVLFDYLDIQKSLEQADIFHRQYQFDAVIAYREFALLPCATIAERLNIKSNCQLDVVEITRNKFEMRERLKNSDLLANVRYQKVDKLSDIENFFSTGIKEAILKPIDGTGSTAIYRVSKENYKQGFAYCIEKTMSELFIEEFIAGVEYSIESISKNGRHEVLAITRKQTTGAPHFIELGHFQPAQMDEYTREKVIESVTQLLVNIGYETGPAHTEIICAGDRIHIVETHTRNGGDNIWLMTKMTSGRDMFKETIATLLDMKIEMDNLIKTRAAKVKYYLERNVLSQSSLDDIQKQWGSDRIIDMKFDDLHSGEITLTNSDDRFGYCLVVGEDEQDIDKYFSLIENSENSRGDI